MSDDRRLPAGRGTRPTLCLGATWQLAEGLGLSGHLYQPTASPYTAFDTNSVIAGPALGTLIVSFQSANEARLSIGSVKPGGPPAIAKQIQRMTYGDPAAATRGVSEMWWGGPAQSGWGVSVIEHTGTFFSVWYTYGADRSDLVRHAGRSLGSCG